MASNKTYTVMKDGETLRELKTLAAAKKLADTEDAKVFCEGLCVYTPDPPVGDGDILPDTEPEAAPVTPAAAPKKYILTAKMNIREAPSLDAGIAGIAKKGTVVEVTGIEDDWLHLSDGTFILYGGGKFAVRN